MPALLVLIAELVDHGNRTTLAVNGIKPPPPIEIPLPGRDARARGQSSPEEIAAFFGGAVRYHDDSTKENAHA